MCILLYSADEVLLKSYGGTLNLINLTTYVHFLLIWLMYEEKEKYTIKIQP